KIVHLLASPFIWLKIHPNTISLLALISVCFVFITVKQEMYVLTSLLILMNGLFDLIDGEVARSLGKSSRFGKFLDRTIDKISDAIILAAFVVYGLVEIKLGIYTMAAMFIATNISANIEGVLHFKISDAVSLRFVRLTILILCVLLKQFWIMFVLLAVLSTYAVLYRFGAACYYYFNRKK
ncbi:MAG: CDP-alcohol phosphatidyltransferase family protein, partial [Candidatus Woesearchaeota archaeon]|nr:CDP-alcohol phosphatidyltransferase family protein [Candidatus Woesearchaeota archaeon]